MRYINKEYGFTFRPPYFDKFYEEKSEGPKVGPQNYPGRYVQGVGYDYSAVNGAVLVGKYGSAWGVRVSYLKRGKWLDSDDFLLSMGAACANTVDGSFAHFSSGPLSVKWVRHNEQSILIRVSAKRKLRVRIICYPCFGFPGELSIEGAFVKGRSPYVAVIPGSIELTDDCAVFRDRYLAIEEDNKKKEYFVARSFNKPSDSANGAFNEAIMEFVINKNQESVYMYAGVGDESILGAEIPRLDKIVNQIETAELRYGVNKTIGSGTLGVAAERMLNSVLWSRLYYPYLLTEIFSPRRATLNNHFDIDGTELNCCALLGSIAISEKAASQLKYTLEDKLMSIISVWFIYAHEREKTEILHLYKKLTREYPPTAELVVSGADKNEVAYKWEDSPLKEKYNSTPMYSLDLSCFRLLAFDVLERIAISFELSESERYAKAKENMRQLINDTFWNDSVGMYVNRYVTGQWANSFGASSFYPLIAGAVDSKEKLTALINNLTSEKLFWSNYVVPTLPVCHCEYGKKGKPNNNGHRNPPYLLYRGSIIPYVNYLIYHGLKRYGLDETAAELALKSAKLWSSNEFDSVVNYSAYLPNGHRNKSGDNLSGNGNLLALMGIEELIDLEYFRGDVRTQALRFGTFAAGSHSLTNYRLLGKTYSIEVGETSTTLICDGVTVFRGDGGRFIVRNFLETKQGCEFMVYAKENVTVNLNIVAYSGKKSTKYVFIVPRGKTVVTAENGMVSIEAIVED